MFLPVKFTANAVASCDLFSLSALLILLTSRYVTLLSSALSEWCDAPALLFSPSLLPCTGGELDFQWPNTPHPSPPLPSFPPPLLSSSPLPHLCISGSHNRSWPPSTPPVILSFLFPWPPRGQPWPLCLTGTDSWEININPNLLYSRWDQYSIPIYILFISIWLICWFHVLVTPRDTSVVNYRKQMSFILTHHCDDDCRSQLSSLFFPTFAASLNLSVPQPKQLTYSCLALSSSSPLFVKSLISPTSPPLIKRLNRLISLNSPRLFHFISQGKEQRQQHIQSANDLYLSCVYFKWKGVINISTHLKSHSEWTVSVRE